jgi:hypothetical protein
MEAVMESHLREHQRLGRDQAVCAWAIVLALAIVFGSVELLWPNTALRTSGSEVATIQRAFDSKQADDNDDTGQAGLHQSDFEWR